MDKARLKDYRFWIFCVCAILFAVLFAFDLAKARLPLPAHYGAASCAFIYVATALPLAIYFVFAAAKHKKSATTVIIIAVMLALSYAVRICFANFQSKDYVNHLSQWVEEYRSLPLADCFIKQVGNYPPLYNYFLIAFSRMNISDLYLIKTLSFYFEAGTVFFAIKLVGLVRKESFNYLWAAIFLLLPIPFTNSSQWAQCDTMYTMCAVAGIYFALKRLSVPAYLFIGLGLALKMQTVLILPVGLVLLLARDTDGRKYLLWRYIWLVPLAFMALSCLPVFFGGSFFKVFDVYFNQVAVGNAGHALNGHCANILLPFSSIPDKSVAYYILLVLFIAITAVTDTLIIVSVLKKSGKVLNAQSVLLLCILLPLNSVFFMPKMLDRFYYIAEIFLIIYFAAYRDKNSFIAYALLETAQWLMYTRTLLSINGLYVISPVFSAAALVIVYAMLIKAFPLNGNKLNGLAALITESPRPQEQKTAP